VLNHTNLESSTYQTLTILHSPNQAHHLHSVNINLKPGTLTMSGQHYIQTESYSSLGL